jgi:hypothetical protein
MDCDVSPYFRQLDVACDERAAIEQALGQAPPEAAEAVAAAQQVLAYCQDRTRLPDVASGSLTERSLWLQKVSGLAGLGPKLDGVKAERLAKAARSTTLNALDGVAARVAPDSTLGGGAASDFLVGQLLGQVCSEPGVSDWLKATCAPPSSGDAIVQLRGRLVVDLVDMPLRAAEKKGLTAQPPAEVQAALSLIRAATSPDAARSLALELAARASAQADAWCAGDDRVAPPRSDALALAGYVILRLLSDAAELDRPDAYYEDLVKKAFVRAGHPLSATSLVAAKQLVQALRQLERAGVPQTPEQALARLDTLTQTLDAVLTLVFDRPVMVAASARALGRAILAAELEDMSRQAFAVTRDLGLVQLTDGQKRALETVVRFSLARDEDEAKRVLRSLFLPRWSENVLFDINADIPRLSSDDFKLVGDLLLGYNARGWGIVGQGAFSEYEFVTPVTLGGGSFTEMSVLDAGGEAWLASGQGSALKLELRLFGRFALYDTAHATFSTAPTTQTETSIMGRAGLLGSVRYQPGERFAGGLWLGGGGQYESYDTESFSNNDAAIADLRSTESFGLLLNGRVRAELAVVPRWLVTRLRVDALRYSLTRQKLSTLYTTDSSGNVASFGESNSTQLEVRARLFLDAEVLRFAGFVPGVNAGFDTAYLTTDGESASSFVPVFGAGVRREAF